MFLGACTFIINRWLMRHLGQALGTGDIVATSAAIAAPMALALVSYKECAGWAAVGWVGGGCG